MIEVVSVPKKGRVTAIPDRIPLIRIKRITFSGAFPVKGLVSKGLLDLTESTDKLIRVPVWSVVGPTSVSLIKEGYDRRLIIRLLCWAFPRIYS